MAKFANLGAWILNGLGAEIDDIESLIGEFPTMNTDIVEDRKLNNEDVELIEIANRLGISYQITDRGIRLG